MGPCPSAGILNAVDSVQNVLSSPRTCLSAARRAVVTWFALIVYSLRLALSDQNIVYEAPISSYALRTSSFGKTGAFGILLKSFGHVVVSEESLVPNSMTPSSKGTKAICAMRYFFAMSARDISALDASLRRIPSFC
eukprot:128271-Prymnesium_polylepis.2